MYRKPLELHLAHHKSHVRLWLIIILFCCVQPMLIIQGVSFNWLGRAFFISNSSILHFLPPPFFPFPSKNCQQCYPSRFVLAVLRIYTILSHFRLSLRTLTAITESRKHSYLAPRCYFYLTLNYHSELCYPCLQIRVNAVKKGNTSLRSPRAWKVRRTQA